MKIICKLFLKIVRFDNIYINNLLLSFNCMYIIYCICYINGFGMVLGVLRFNLLW